MSDYSELKRLAEAATKCSGSMRVEKDYNGVHQVIGDGSWKILNVWNTPDGKSMQNAQFYAAASPTVVMSLIATIDVLRSDTESRCEWANEASAEIDRLQNIECERDQLKAENERLTAELDCPFRLARHSKRLVEQLRAEVAGLKTGYEAYERVNAELKAECEALHKGAARYEWLRQARSGYIEVVEWIGPHATGMTGEDLDALLDAAMGKGEKS